MAALLMIECWLNQHGEEFVAANRKDGLAAKRLKDIGIKVVITSTGNK